MSTIGISACYPYLNLILNILRVLTIEAMYSLGQEKYARLT